MISWFKYPFIRLLIPFSIGIYVAFSFFEVRLEKESVRLLLIIIFLILLSLVLISIFIKNYRFRWIFSVLLFSYLILLGFVTVLCIYFLPALGLG